MFEPVLRELNIIDCRPIGNEISFQSETSPRVSASNRHLLYGMSEEEAKRIDEFLESSGNDKQKRLQEVEKWQEKNSS